MHRLSFLNKFSPQKCTNQDSGLLSLHVTGCLLSAMFLAYHTLLFTFWFEMHDNTCTLMSRLLAKYVYVLCSTQHSSTVAKMVTHF